MDVRCARFFISDRGKPSFWEKALQMTRRKKIYEGKAKILYEGPEPVSYTHLTLPTSDLV